MCSPSHGKAESTRQRLGLCAATGSFAGRSCGRQAGVRTSDGGYAPNKINSMRALNWGLRFDICIARIGAFSLTSLELNLQGLGVRNLVVIGVATDVCALACALGSHLQGVYSAGSFGRFGTAKNSLQNDLRTSFWNYSKLLPGSW